MKNTLKTIINNICRTLIFPVYIIVQTSQKISGSENTFLYFAQTFSRCSGKTGEFIRRAYYNWTLKKTGKNLVVGFGSLFTHREVTLGNGIWIGQYSIIGRTRIKSNVLISDHVSILSGRHHHKYNNDNTLIEDRENLSTISLERNSWIGAGTVVMADVGEGSIVGAGSVVVKKVASFSVVAGNPARFIRKHEEGLNIEQ